MSPLVRGQSQQFLVKVDCKEKYTFSILPRNSSTRVLDTVGIRADVSVLLFFSMYYYAVLQISH